MDQQDLRQIPLVALFSALAILFPQFFHLLGLGPAFLPMFIPIMIGSMFLHWRFVFLMAIISPTISWLFTGMPPIAPPILPVLIIEFIIAGLIISRLRVKSSLPVWGILLIAIISDRLTLLLIVTILAPLFDIDHPLFTIAIVISGLPGIILQLITVPLTVYFIEKKYPHWKP
jgi:hypothetical protein